MAQESRVKKTLLNARVNLIFYFLTLCLSFFSRKIFLDCLGADFVGLTGTLQNLLGFLNLAELGIGSAIGYLLYKPLFDHDQEKINEIISVMGYLYRWIGLIILGGGCILACFLPLIFPDSDTGFNLPLIYFAYFSFLGSTLIGYFINYRQNLLGADQKNYVVTAYFQTCFIVKTSIQMASAYFTESYYLWIFIEFGFGIIYSFILNWKINQTYPWLKSRVKQGRQLFRKYPEVFKYTRQLFVHKISSFAQTRVTPILIYAFVSLETVAYFTNYTIVFDRINLLLGSILGSLGAGVGNLIAEGNRERIVNVFWELLSFQYYVYGIVLFGLYSFTNTFITLWLGHQYVLSDVVLWLLLANMYFGMVRNSVDPFIFGNGMFSDIWAPLTEAAIYVVVALIAGHLWGLPGVLLGNTVSLFVIIGGWKPYFLFSKGFDRPYLEYVKNAIARTLIMCIAIFMIHKVCSVMVFTVTWSGIITEAIVKTSIFSILYFLMCYILYDSFRKFVSRFLISRISGKLHL